MNGPVYNRLMDARRNGAGFLWLVDPDKIDPRRPDPRWERAGEHGVAAFLVGTSQNSNPGNDIAVACLHEHARLPLILFPGSASQVTPHVDAVLFLSLLSGRNPDYLVGEQVKGTPLIRQYRIEPIPTGYLLIDTGTATSVTRWSGTAPMPQSEIRAICDHALCAEYMGKAFVYLEAGSGADQPIAPKVIEKVKNSISIPLIVGGGIRTPDQCVMATAAGADFVVVGTALEIDQSAELLSSLAGAARGGGRSVSV
jgi:phosphoglycerol geranylgeranyltransferase